jgi:hypothetical protein
VFVREAMRLLMSVAVQLFGLYAVVGGIVYGPHIFPENRDPVGLLLVAGWFIVVETLGLALLVAGARMRGKRQSGGFPLDSH